MARNIVEVSLINNKSWTSPCGTLTINGNTPTDIGNALRELRLAYLANPGHNKIKTIFSQNRMLVGGDPEFFVEDSVYNKAVNSFIALKQPPNSKELFYIYPSNSYIQTLFKLDRMHNMYSFKSIDVFQRELCDATGPSTWFHQDGVPIEIGYLPHVCLEITSNRIQSMLQTLNYHINNNGYNISSRTSIDISNKDAELLPIGCRPSYNAYNLANEINDLNPTRRFTGGHFHFVLFDNNFFNSTLIGYSYNTFNDVRPQEYTAMLEAASIKNIDPVLRRQYFEPVIRALDATIGVLSIAIGGALEDPARRQYKYGMAGDYRLTDATLEYRTPSNVMWMSPVTWHLMSMIGRHVVYDMLSSPKSSSYRQLNNKSITRVVNIINNTDVEAAKNYLTENNASVLRDMIRPLPDAVMAGDGFDKIYHLIQSGMEKTVSNNIIENWNLGATVGTGFTGIKKPHCL